MLKPDDYTRLRGKPTLPAAVTAWLPWQFHYSAGPGAKRETERLVKLQKITLDESTQVESAFVTADSRPAAHARVHIPDSWLVAGLALSAVVVVALMWHQHLGIAVGPVTGPIYGLAAVLALGLHLRRKTHAERRGRVAEFIGHAAAFTMISVMGAIASYPAAAASAGYVDPALQRIDHTLHFDWLAWYSMVCSHPLLQWAGEAAYASIYVTPVILLGYLAHAGRRGEARLFLITFWIASILTLALFPWIPARGPLAVMWQGRIPYMPMSALYQSQLIPQLRAHTLGVVDLGALRGLVCAPSFHTAAAVVYAFTAWPIRRLRWPLLALNAMMLLSTPVEGTHYLADMLGGALVAFTAIMLTAAYTAARGQRRWRLASPQ